MSNKQHSIGIVQIIERHWLQAQYKTIQRVGLGEEDQALKAQLSKTQRVALGPSDIKILVLKGQINKEQQTTNNKQRTKNKEQ
jgi:hypothetical protein